MFRSFRKLHLGAVHKRGDTWGRGACLSRGRLAGRFPRGGRSSPTAGPALFAAATTGKVRPPRGVTAAVRLPQRSEHRAARGHGPRCSVHPFPAASPPCKHFATPIRWQGRAGIAGTREQWGRTASGTAAPSSAGHGAGLPARLPEAGRELWGGCSGSSLPSPAVQTEK